MRTHPLRRVTFCLLLLLSATSLVRADKPRASGYYIDLEGNRHEGMIEVPLQLMNKKVSNTQRNHFTYFDKRSKESKLDASKAREFGFTYEGEKVVFRLLPKIIQKSTLVIADFYRLMIDGPCCFYLANSSESGNGLQYCLYKDEDHYFLTNPGVPNPFAYPKGRVKELRNFFEDCPALIEKMKKKEFTRGDERYWEMVDYYNSSCVNQAVETTETEE